MSANHGKTFPEECMGKARRVFCLLAIALFMGSCATFDDSMATMKKTFPGRVDKPAADNNTRK
jgi:hypothetical protein